MRTETMTVRQILNGWPESDDIDAAENHLRANDIDPNDLATVVEVTWPDHCITRRLSQDTSIRIAR